MEPVPTKVTPATPRGVRLVLLAAVLAVGCTSSMKLPGSKKSEAAYDPSTPAQLAVTWNPKVVYAADPTRGGTIMPVLTGRIYLFAANIERTGHPLVCEGRLQVDLWDHTARSGKTEPQMLETWEIDPVSFTRLLKEDIIGQGYSVALPWSTYREDISGIHLIVRFDPTNGKGPILQQSGITVDHVATKELQTSNMMGR